MRLWILVFGVLFSADLWAICFGDFCPGGPQVAVPSTPQNVRVPAKSSSGDYSLSWNSSFMMQTLSNYKIEESNSLTSYRSIAQVTQNTLSYSISKRPNGTYTYRVKACNVDPKYGTEKCSAWGYSQSIVVNALPSTPATPTGPSVSDSGAYTIAWLQPSGSATSYSLRERVNNGSWVTKVSSTTARGYSFSGKTNGVYDYQVRACNAGGCSAYSNYKRVTVQLSADNLIPDASLVTPNVPDNQAIGALEGQAGVSGGAATYNIPIAVPPGRAGMQPNVSLNYSSRSGNGIAGVGWSLGVGSSIHRCGKTAAQDGYGLGVTYSATNDRLCLDGKRLMVVAGTYGVSGAQYRTEIDSFVKVTQSGNINGSTTSFAVYHKNGHIARYGTTTDSRHIASGRSEILTWAIKKKEDSTGNNIFFNYQEFGEGEFLLTSINYTGYGSSTGDRRVAFVYQSGERDDGSMTYLQGGLSSKTKLLSSIETFVGQTKVKDYTLAYSTSATSKRSVVSTISECAFDDSGVEACLPATSFNTHSQNLAWDEADSSNANQSPIADFGVLEGNDRILLKDIDGNGVAEALYMDERDDGSFDVRVYTLNTQGKYIEQSNANLGGYDYLIYAGIEGDINGDGITDFITSDNRRLVYFQFDQNFKLVRHVTNFYFAAGYDRIYGGQGLQVTDVDSDGYQDILFTSLKAGSTTKIAYYKNKGAGNVDFSGPYYLLDVGAGSGSGSASAIDLDGDGLLDFSELARGDAGRVESVYFSERGSNGVITLVNKSSSSLGLDGNADKVLFADLNGDGLKDYVFVKNASSGGKKWHVQINKGNRSFAPAYSLNTNIGIPDMYSYPAGTQSSKKISKVGRVTSADLDGDGAEELLIATHTNDDFSVSLVGWLLNNDGTTNKMINVCVANDALYVKETTDLSCDGEGHGSDMSVDFSGYDFRRYAWSVVDFESSNGQLTHQRTVSNVAEAPLNGFKFLDGASVQPLSFKDYNNDGLTDLSFVTLSGFVTPKINGVVRVQGYEVKGGFSGRFATGSDRPINGMFLQENLLEHSSRQVDKLYRVTDGLTNVAEWDFSPISRSALVNGSAIYSVPSDRENWYINGDSKREHFYFTSSMPVVSNFRLSNGIGSLNETTYRYKEAIYNRKGRGFQGFRTIIVDSSNGLRSVSDFSQMFPFAGKLEEARTCLQSDSLCLSAPLNKTTVNFDKIFTTPTNKTYWVYPKKSVKEDHSLASQLLSTSTTNITSVDTYGNVKSSNSTVFNGFSEVKSTTSNSYYAADESTWWVNKLKNSTVQSQTLTSSGVYLSQLDSLKSVTTHIDSYDSLGSRLPTKIRSVPADGKSTQVDTQFNQYGLPTNVITTSEGKSRSVTTNYSKNGDSKSSDGYFVYEVIDDLNQKMTNKTVPHHGQSKAVIDANILEAKTEYDSFGRVEKVIPPAGTGQPVYSRFASCSGDCDGHGFNYAVRSRIAYKVTSYQAGAPKTIVYKDKLNRVIATAVQAFNQSNYSYTTVQYDELGRKVRETSPSYSASNTKGTVYNSFDPLGRLTSKTVDNADGKQMTVTYSFSNHTTNIVASGDGKVIDMSRVYSSNGQLMKTVDALGGETLYAYDAMGNPIVLQDANNNQITATYNDLGQKKWVNDPNMGNKTFTYTGLGQVYSEQDANGDKYYYQYDDLGRLTHRYLNGLQSSQLEAEFFFSDNNCTGVPSKELRHNLPTGQNFERTYQYDDYCRAHQVTTKVDGNNYISKVLYDGNYGRVKGKQYPNGLVVAYQYDLNTGYLNETKNAVDGTVYRKIEAVDALGNWTQAKLSNNAISINRAFDLQGGQMRSTELKKGSLVQQLINYSAYDGFGNLETVEASTRIGNTFYSDVESYQYDDLHRLTRSTLTQSGSLRNEYFYNYDKVGNFQYKTDFSTSASNAYRFGNKDKNLGGNAGPNAVRQVALANGRGNRYYQYDNNGNLINDGTRNIVYNAFNKPTQITVSNNMRLQPYDSSLTSAASLNFFYSADQMRYKQVKTAGSTSTTTIYIDKSYEKITQGSTVTHKAYVDDIAVVTQVGSSTNLETTYFHKDRLGSTIASVNANGDISNCHSFDPFGKPRDGRMNDNKTSSAIAVNILNDDKTTRGFTDHEHLDDAQLIHMNGRVYDYNLGRFLSADPFIQDPENSQSMNPYSYIMNNPLAGTDPTGYVSCDPSDDACKTSGSDDSGRDGDSRTPGLKSKIGNRTVGAKGGTWTGTATDSNGKQVDVSITVSNSDAESISDIDPDDVLSITTSASTSLNTGSGGSNSGGIWNRLISSDPLTDEEIDDIWTLVDHHSKEGTINNSLGTFTDPGSADRAAHNFYNPLSQNVEDEAQWYVIRTGVDSSGKDIYGVTYATVGSLSEGGSPTGVDTNAAFAIIKRTYGKPSMYSSGHTHWDNNQKFSGWDARYVQGITKISGIHRDFFLTVSTSDGSYRKLDRRRARGNENDMKVLGRVIDGPKIRTH